MDERQERWKELHHQLVNIAGLPANRVERVSAVNGSVLLSGTTVDESPNCSPKDRHFACGFNSREMLLDRLCAAGLLSRLGRLRLEAPSHEKIWGMDLTEGALGCALSHLNVWRSIVETEASVCSSGTNSFSASPRYLVVEDDAVFPPDFLSLYQQRVSVLENVVSWELLHLGGLDTGKQCCGLRRGSAKKKTSRDCSSVSRPNSSAVKMALEQISRVPQLHRTTTAYVVTPTGAFRLSQVCFPLTFQLDTEMNSACQLPSPTETGEEEDEWESVKAFAYVRDPPCLTLQPPLVRQNERFSSDIQLTDSSIGQ